MTLTYVHNGAFSGSAPLLRSALEARTGVTAVDLMPLARSPRLLSARMRAQVESHGGPWTKTAAWPAAVQAVLARRGLLAGPLLIVQSQPALVPPPGVRYAVYTDRVGLEGAEVGGEFRSRFTDGWLAREKAMLRGAHRVFVMGPSTAGVLISEYGIPEAKVRVVGAGVNVPPVSADRSGGPGDLLFVGTQWKLKGGPELLDAVAKLRAEDDSWTLTLAGSAPEGELPPGVRSLGRIPRERMSAGAYARAGITVIPTHMEAFGIALVESLVHGVPCVASTVGNQPWIIGDAGLCVAPGDPEALASALRTVRAGHAAFTERAEERREFLRTTMTWDTVAEAILKELL